MIYTTLNRIKVQSPCEAGWKKLLRGLKKSGADDAPLGFDEILRINGADDALWCLRAEPQHDRLWRMVAVRCARTVQHLMTDPHSLAALDVAERHANGLATDAELAAARAAAWDAAWDAARAAARAAAWDAASVAAAWDAARDAARAAAWDAAWDAARDAARAAAWDAASVAAAWDAARDAARAAARAAAWDAAWDAARDAARDAAMKSAGETMLSAVSSCHADPGRLGVKQPDCAAA